LIQRFLGQCCEVRWWIRLEMDARHSVRVFASEPAPTKNPAGLRRGFSRIEGLTEGLLTNRWKARR
jgi:hypothetical protein